MAGEIASASFITMFGDEVHHAQQAKASNLQSAVRTVRGVVGSSYKFPVLGKSGVIVNKDAGTDLDVMSSSAYGSLGTTTHATNEYKTEAGTAATSQVTATIKTFATGEYIDNFSALMTNVDLRSAYAESIASAMNRAYDEQIIEALDYAAANSTLAAELAGEDVDRTALLLLHKALNEKDVPMDDRYLVINPTALNTMLTQSATVGLVNDSDGPLSQALVSGRIANVLGFNVIVSNQLNAGTVDTNDTMCFAFHKAAVGMAISQDIKTEVNYIPEKLATLVSSTFSGGAVAIDANGIASMEVN